VKRASFREIQERIKDRHSELHTVTELLAGNAFRAARLGKWAKVSIIILGAFAATKGAADQILGSSSKWSLATYTIAGLLTAAIGGLEAAFKKESTAAELRNLVAACQSTLRHVDTEWQKGIGAADNPDVQITNALALLDLQDTKLTEIQEKASKLGTDIVLQVRQLQTDEAQPYSA
jgi:hypothetical protein